MYNQTAVNRSNNPLAALAIAACALVGAGSTLADPPQDQRQAFRPAPAAGWVRRDEAARSEPARANTERPYGGPPRGVRSPYVDAPAPGRGPNSLGADWRQQQEEARFGVNQGRLAPLGGILADIGRRTPGRLLDSGIENTGGRAVYRVRWMANDGRRIDYFVDARTGTIIGEH